MRWRCGPTSQEKSHPPLTCPKQGRFRGEGVNDTEVVDVAGNMWKKIADPQAALAVASKVPGRFEHGSHLLALGGFQLADDFPGRPAVEAVQEGLVVKAVDLGNSSLAKFLRLAAPARQRPTNDGFHRGWPHLRPAVHPAVPGSTG